MGSGDFRLRRSADKSGNLPRENTAALTREDVMPDIGIIGGGVGGTQLGLFLRQQDVSATIYTAKTPAEHLAALANAEAVMR